MAVLTAGSQTVLKPDRPSMITEVRFFSTGTLAAATVALQAAGIALYGGSQVPLPLLVTRAAVDVQSGVMGFLYIMRPDAPWSWTQEMPLYITPSANMTVVVHGYPLNTPAAGG